MPDRVPDEVRRVAASAWVDAVAAASAGGWPRYDWMGAVDELARSDEIRIVCRLLDAAGAAGLRLETLVPRDGGELASVAHVFAGAAWAQREVHDFFGVRFTGADQTPLLLQPGFEGRPLRKDEPLVERLNRPEPVSQRGRRRHGR